MADTTLRGTYYRWSDVEGGQVRADILGSKFAIVADPQAGHTVLTVGDGRHVVQVSIDPDEARMIGVRLVESAVIADARRSVRTAT